MSKVSVARWMCDRCGRDGGVVDANETLPNKWLSMRAVLGVPQIQSEQLRGRTIHFCHECTETLLFHSLISTDDEVERLRVMWRGAA